MPMYSVTGQYVTISGTCTGWCLFDEMQILSPTGTVISTGDTYTVTPQPTNGPGGGTTYGDDGYKLTDGDIIPDYGPQFADALDSFTASTGGTVQATWATPHTPASAAVWMTAPGQQHRRHPAPVRHHLLAQRQQHLADRDRRHPHRPAAAPAPAPNSPSPPARRSPGSKPPSPAAAPPATGTSSASSAPSNPHPVTRTQ